jgi:hypothetical protein
MLFQASIVRHTIAPLKRKSTFDRNLTWHLSRKVEPSYLHDGNKLLLRHSAWMAFFRCKSVTHWNEVLVV